MTHHIFELLRGALVHYGYWAVAAMLLLENAGVPLPGETILLLASFLAYSEHELRLPWVIVVGTVASTLGGEFGFALGRHGGRPLIERYRHVFSIRAETVARGDRLFERYGAATVFLARFIVRDAGAGFAAGGRAPHAVAKVRPVQFSGSGGLGDVRFAARDICLADTGAGWPMI